MKSDLMCFKRLHPGPAQSREFGECDKDRFFVGHKQAHRVVFEQVNSEIRIGRWEHSGEHTPLMVLTVRLDDDGECVLIDEDQKVWKPWQVRRIALEETLFGAA